MNFKADVYFAQRFLSCAGFYEFKIDGSYGDKTRIAEDAFNKSIVKCAEQYGRFDERSEGVIATLLPKTQIAARKFLIQAKNFPLTVKLISGTRSYAEQNGLYSQKPKVTNAKGGQSNHNFGIAYDVGIFSGTKYYTGATAKEENAYKDLASLILPTLKELDWGGNWKSIIDRPHYELKCSYSVTQRRTMFEAGKAFV